MKEARTCIDHRVVSGRATVAFVLTLCAALLIGVRSPIMAAEPQSIDRLPSGLVRETSPVHAKATRGWTIRDIVEIRQIRSLAVSRKLRQVAFLVRQPQLDSGAIRYGLYVVDIDGSSPARKLIEAPFISDLSRNPNESDWTVLADLGSGVQLYNVGDGGASLPLVVNSETAVVGTWDGVVPGTDEPHSTGILSYEWSPDGTSLWYSRLRLRSPAERQSFIDQGIRYDDRTMAGALFHAHPGELLGVELHVLTQSPTSDRTVAFAPSVSATNLALMRRALATAYWAQDSRHILYSATSLSTAGPFVTSQWSVDVKSGKIDPVPSRLPLIDASPTADGSGYLSVSSAPDGVSHLVEYGKDGNRVRDYGESRFKAVGMDAELGAWRSQGGQAEILGVSYRDRDGLISVPDSDAATVWTTVTDNISRCSFSKDLSFGACVRDNLTLPPEVVLVEAKNGSIRTLIRPNSSYDDIQPLRSEHATWKNRYGDSSDGYIAYPPGYSPPQKYPAIVVTHATGARNEFANRGFQAEIPIQVLAEAGYIVLSVNEAQASWRVRAHLHESVQEGGKKKIAQTQFALVLDAVASMEAALQDLINRGIVDRERTGIAGYSRGAEVAAYVMTQSKMFKAASLGDGSAGVNSDGYWSWGTRGGPAWYESLYGGSAYDSDAYVRGNYRKLSPAFRAHSFAGPLLEQSTETMASFVFERMTLLRKSGIPVELEFYPNESHILWHPGHAAAAMQRTVEWFNYWLLGKRDPSSSKNEQYLRWQAMNEIYNERRSATQSTQGSSLPARESSR
jgi:dipeptidyl aminopeptidase/acylaminoacyl peptidase